MAKTAHTIRISSFLEVLRLEGHGRIARIDELRGALILLVLIYHLLYDITLFFPAAAPRLWLLGDAMRPLRAVVPGLFILLCGMCTHLSRNNMRRGLWCALFAGGIRLVSGIVSPACPIRFGILDLLALCLLLWCALHRPLAQMHLPPWAAMVGGGLLFALTYRLEQGYFAGMPLPAALWDREWLLWLGLPCRRLLSADYFPLLPWGGLFWAGCGLGQWLFTPPYIDRLRQSRSPGMARLGRHTLALYLCHQPVWFAGLWLLRAAHG